MNKKLINSDLDIPVSDYECWQRYPRYRWVYELSRLYDSQNIAWSTTEIDSFVQKHTNLSGQDIPGSLGTIYTQQFSEKTIKTEVFLVKGEIKKYSHCSEIEESGELEIRVAAFVSLHFSRFTGIITMEISGKDIVRISLKPESELAHIEDKELVKLIKRIYKKQEVPIIGLQADRILREPLAS